jgi:hypothetical protein
MGVAMPAGTIAGDRIRPLAGPAPTPRVSPRATFRVCRELPDPGAGAAGSPLAGEPPALPPPGQPPRSTPGAPGPVAGPPPKTAHGIVQRSR